MSDRALRTGDLAWIHGRMVLDNIDVPRSSLLDGRLAAPGVFDRAPPTAS